MIKKYRKNKKMPVMTLKCFNIHAKKKYTDIFNYCLKSGNLTFF